MLPQTAQPRRDLLAYLWRAGNATGLSLALLVLLCAALVLAAIFPQKPLGLEGAAAERWFAAAVSSFRGTGMFLRAVGAFNVLEALWLRILLAVLAYHLLLRLAALATDLRRTTPLSQPPAVASGQLTLQEPLDRALPRVRDLLAGRFPLMTVESGASRGMIYAQNRRSRLLGPLLACAGPLVMFAGLLLNDAFGWRAADIALVPQSSAALNLSPGLRLELHELAGIEPGSKAIVALSGPQGHSPLLELRAGRPARWGNLWIIQRMTGPALAIGGTDRLGQPLVLHSLLTGGEAGPEIHVLFRPSQPEPTFAAPSLGLVFRAISYLPPPEQGGGPPVFLIEAYRDDETSPILSQPVEEVGVLAIGEASLTVRQTRYASLEVAYLPGLSVSLLGGLAAAAGFVLVLAWRPVRAWVALTARGEVTLADVAASTPLLTRVEQARLMRALGSPPRAE